MLYIKLFIEREKNIGQSAPECPFNALAPPTGRGHNKELRHNYIGIGPRLLHLHLHQFGNFCQAAVVFAFVFLLERAERMINVSAQVEEVEVFNARRRHELLIQAQFPCHNHTTHSTTCALRLS